MVQTSLVMCLFRKPTTCQLRQHSAKSYIITGVASTVHWGEVLSKIRIAQVLDMFYRQSGGVCSEGCTKQKHANSIFPSKHRKQRQLAYERRAKPLMCCSMHSSQSYRCWFIFFSVDLIVPGCLDYNNMDQYHVFVNVIVPEGFLHGPSLYLHLFTWSSL